MPRPHSAPPEPDAPTTRRWLAGVLIVVAALWIVDLALLGTGTPDPLDDTWEYGVAARHLLAGEGFRTSVIHPPLWSLRDPRGTVPVLVHGPLLPLLAAPAIAAFGDAALERIAWLAALAALGTAWLVFRLGARRFEPPVGAAAALAWTLSPLTLRAVHHDVALPVGALLLALALDLLARERPRAAAAGLALGAGILVRPEFLIALPVMLPLAGRRWWRTAVMALLVWAPWGVHAWRAAGSPFFNLSSYMILGYWGSRPGLSAMRDFALPPAAFPGALRAALPDLATKAIDYLPHALKRALLTPSGATGWLAVLGLGAALALPRARRLAAVALALAAIPVAIMSLTLYDSRYLVPFLPLWALAAAWGARTASSLLPAWGRRPRAWIGVLLLLLLPSFAPALRSAVAEGAAARARLASLREALEPFRVDSSARGGRVAPLFTDAPDLAAWTTRRAAVWLTPAEVERLPRAALGAGPRPSPACPSREDGLAIWLLER